ncbi:ABC transporter substrate binding protein [Pelagibaculum spongiae]|uniref:ABC transporter substrate-binding protein n=1 Tax=Pelagibaculum spongiae TaxID=2080658 RepID=A0A2V1GSA4_9GAMM|nr:ABC transporter substrate binding protein [Pelagibaculum spongiae]PVZ64928.1 hypothetical protein DC094_18875 [Pelagibaculum spongiae]
MHNQHITKTTIDIPLILSPTFKIIRAVSLLLLSAFFSQQLAAREKIIVAGDSHSPAIHKFYQSFAEQLASNSGNFSSQLHLFSSDKKLFLNPGDWLVCLGIECLAQTRGFDHKKTIALMVNNKALLGTSWHKTLPIVLADQPFERYLKLTRAIIPNSKNLIALVPPPQQRLANLKNIARSNGYSLIGATVSGNKMPLRILERLLKRADAVILLPEPKIIAPNNIQPMLLSTFRARVPSIAFSPAYVAAGALAGLYSTPQQYAFMAHELLEKLWLEENIAGKQHPWLFDLSINQNAAKSLGITLPTIKLLMQQLHQ